MRVIVRPDADPSLCDKCGERVPPENDLRQLLYHLGVASALQMLLTLPRHLLPTERCEGSPSRVQYLAGQPRDSRGYPYDPRLVQPIRAAYARMQREARA